MEKKEIVYLDKVGYEKLLEEINKIREELKELKLNKSDAYENGGDGFHDNFSFEDSERRERALIYLLAERTEYLERVEIVNKQDKNDIIDIGDLVSLTIDFDGEKETDTYRLTGLSDASIDDGIINVTLNSPLGKVIYLQNVGIDTSYFVDNNKFLVHINEKISEEKLDNSKKNTR